MATRLYLTSAEGRAGKSIVAVGLLEALRARVARVGVFRPVARSADSGDYVHDLLREHATVEVEPAATVGTTYERLRADPDAARAAIVERFADLERGCDAVLIIGSDYTDVDSPIELAMNGRIAADLGAPVVLVVNGRDEDGTGRDAGAVQAAAEVAVTQLRVEHAAPVAIVVNRVEAGATADVLAALRERGPSGIPAWAIPEDPVLAAPLLRAVFEAVDAELLLGDAAGLDAPVLGVVIAGMTLENVLPRLVEGAVVIVPGDRADVLIGAVAAHVSKTSPSLSGILLNGGFPLDPGIRRLLDGLEVSIPVGRTPFDTYETGTRVHGARTRFAAGSPQRYARAVASVEQNVDTGAILAALDLPGDPVVTPVRFEQSLLERARRDVRHIVLPEGDDDRIVQAAGIVLARGIARITLLGDETAIRARAAELGVDIAAAAIRSPLDAEPRQRFADEYLRLRAHKGISPDLAADTVTDVSYFGTMMVHLGLADGMVSGARHTTAHTIRPAFEIIRTAPGASLVSSVFFMALPDRVLVYGDCAIVPEPTAEQLAEIAVASAATARRFGIEPRVALLSYSTGDSGSGADVDRVRAATELARSRAPGLPLIGPVQYDAAADPEVGRLKMPDSEVAGRATVFVFPDLDTGNNTYKAVQRSAGAVAIGPVLQGLAKPVNDLSRGATVRDIVNTIAITAIQAQEPDA